MRKIAIVTGTRAEYGLLRRVMELIAEDSQLDLDLYVTGMHLSPSHGETIDEIQEDGFEIGYQIDMNLDSRAHSKMSKALGIGITGLSDAFRNRRPDIVVVLGDRSEPFAAAIAASHMNIPVAHIAGGQISGGSVIDSQVRHAITKLSHLHFVTSKENEQRVQHLGEEPWRIFSVGALGVDDIHFGEYESPSEIQKKLDLPRDNPIAIILQHPETTNPSASENQLQKTVNAVTSLDCHPVIIYPNSDLGSENMISYIESTAIKEKNVSVHKNLERETFLGLMNISNVLVGNSSSGIIEAPSFGLPVVNIGSRQEGRQQTDNVVNVRHSEDEIKDAVKAALFDEKIKQRAKECENPYFLGGASDQIHSKIKNININKNLIKKGTEL